MANEYEPVGEKKGGHSCLGICCGAICCLLIIAIWGVIPYVFGAVMGFNQFIVMNPGMVYEYIDHVPPLTPQTIPNTIWWPGCTYVGNKTAEYLQNCSKPCYSPTLIPSITDFNTKHPFKLVTYLSRKDTQGKTYNLTGWLLPGDKANLPPGHLAPRVVINHGFTSNSNKWYPTLSAYYMRSMGFDVLLNNIRGVGYSQKTSKNIVTWGYEYHYDLLGAWDFLVSDSDNILGGKQSAKKVGIMGYSMGAFITLNAFTLDKTIPAAWADSPPLSPKDVFFHGASQHAAGAILKIPGVAPLIWFWMSNTAGVDLEARTPAKNIPTGPEGKRPVQIASNLKDETVPGSNVKSIAELISKNPSKYNMSAPIYTDAKCNNEHHLVSMLLEPDTYRQKLCDFWTSALGEPKTICGLIGLPKFGNSSVATSRRLAVVETRVATSVVV